jgi:4-hydroxy-tetrahydrodipicolinate synthase
LSQTPAEDFKEESNVAKPPQFRGVFAYPITPTTADGAKVDERRLRELIDEFIEAGVSGIVVLGSTGAIGSFGEAERMAIAQCASSQIAGRVPLLVGTGAMTTDEAVRLSRHAESVGAAGLQVVPMSHWPLTDGEVVTHFEKIARTVSIPIAVHNCPSLTGIDMKPALLARLAGIPNVAYLKEGSGDLSRVPVLRRLTGGKVPIFQDSETTAMQGLLGGADVWATMMPNVFPRHSVELFELAAVRKDVEAARRLFERMFPVIEFMFEKSGVRALHAALEILGRPAGAPRSPIRPLDAADRPRLEQLLRASGDLVRWGERQTVSQ